MTSFSSLPPKERQESIFPPAASASPFAADLLLDRFDLAHLARRYSLLLILLPVLFAAAAFGIHLQRKPLFESSALLMVDSSLDRLLEFEKVDGGAGMLQESLKSLEIALVADSVVLRVVERLSLREASGFLPAEMASNPNLPDGKLINFLRKNRIRATLQPETRLIQVAVKDSVPERAQLIASTFVEEFESFLADSRKKEVNRVRAAIEEQVGEARETALEAEERLRTFRETHAGLPVEQDEVVFAERLSQLGTDLNQALRSRVELEALHRSLGELDPATEAVHIIEISEYGNSGHISDILTALASARSRLAGAEKQFTTTHPSYLAAQAEVSRYEEEISKLAADVKSTVAARFQASSEKESLLREELAKLQNEFLAVKSSSAEFRALKEETENRWLHHQNLQKRLSENIISAEMPGQIATVVSEPLLPHSPAGPTGPLLAAIGVVFGLFVAAGLVGWRILCGLPYTDKRQLEERFGNPVLVDWSDPSASSTDALLVHGAKTVFVTSPASGGVAETSAAELAERSARRGRRTLLIRIRNGAANPSIRPSALASLSFCELAPEDILDETRFASALPRIEESFDAVFIESDPIADNCLASWLAGNTDRIVVVLPKGSSTRPAVDRQLRRLDRSGHGSIAFLWIGSIPKRRKKERGAASHEAIPFGKNTETKRSPFRSFRRRGAKAALL